MPSPSIMLAEAAGGGYPTFYLLATALAAGIAAALPLVPIRDIGRKFFILLTLVAVVFYALAVTARGLWTEYLHFAAAGLLILYNVFVSDRGGPLSKGCLLAAAGFGAAGLVSDAMSFPAELPIAGSQALWLSASFLSSAAVLGGAAVAMLLGHWYLVAHGLSFDVLRRVVWFLLAAIAIRAAVVAWVAVEQAAQWKLLWSEAGGAAGFFVSQGIFAGARALFGLVLPLVLTAMALQCVRIRSNQSATGILYVVLAFALIGEAIAKHVLVSNLLLL